MKKYNFAIIGLGGIAKTHLIGLNSANIIYNEKFGDFNIHSLCTRSGHTELDIFDSVSANIEEILENKEIDIVDICTPNFLHKDQCLKSFKYNKHVYLEKPITSNIEDAELLNEEAKKAEKRGIFNQVAFVLRYLPSVVMAKEYIKRGYLGDIINFRSQLFHNSYLDPDRPISWRLKKEYSGGGALMDLGIHLLDLIRFVLGEVREISAETDCYFKERFSDNSRKNKERADVDEWAKVNLILSNGGRGTVEVSRISSELNANPLLEIYGTKGKITISTSRPDYPEIYHHKKGMLEIGSLNFKSDFIKAHKKIYPADRIDMGWFINTHLAGLMHFFNRLNTGEKFAELPDIKDGLLAQNIVDKAYFSAANNNKKVLLS